MHSKRGLTDLAKRFPINLPYVIVITNKKFLAAALLTSMVLLLFLSASPTIGQAELASLKIQRANEAIGQALNGTLSAEKAGANVTGLLEQLNVATGLLAQAENSYRTGDTSAPANYANQAIPIAQQVKAQATALKNSAVSSKQNDFVFTVVFVVMGSEVFILGLLFVWRLVKKRYVNEMLESKPEVANN
jgi:hypothetical protein